jgi:proteasome lid subunit RPN8/RPN11
MLKVGLAVDWPEEFKNDEGHEQVCLLGGYRKFDSAQTYKRAWHLTAGTGEFSVMSYLLVGNLAEDPYNNFAISKGMINEAEKHFASHLFDLIGVAHTHPGGPPWPSGNDIEGIKSGWLGAVVLPPRCSVAWYLGKKEVDG